MFHKIGSNRQTARAGTHSPNSHEKLRKVCFVAMAAAIDASGAGPMVPITSWPSMRSRVRARSGWPDGPVCTGAMAGHSAPVTTVAVHPEGNMLATAARDASIMLWVSVFPMPNTPSRCLSAYLGPCILTAFVLSLVTHSQHTQSFGMNT